jgi:hypothetical protein
MAFGNIGQIPPNYLASSILTSQEIAFIQNLNSRASGNANNVVLMNSNNGGLAGQYLRVNAAGTGLEWASGGGGGGGATTFLQLTDTPSSYANHGLKLVNVNSSENALEFTPITSFLVSGPGISISGTTFAYIDNTGILSLTAGSGISISGGQNATITNTGVRSLNSATGALTLQGTTDQVNVSTSDSTITLSTPQDIHTEANPTFASLTLKKSTSGNLLVIRNTGDTADVFMVSNSGNLVASGTGTFNTSPLTIGNLVLSASGLTASRTFTFPNATTTLVGTDTSQSLSNKRIYPRQLIQASPSSITPNKSQYDEYYVTALANNITINNATSPSVGDTFLIYITDNGNARSIYWQFHYVGLGTTLPGSTTNSKTMEIIIKYVEPTKALVSYKEQV